MRHVLSLVLVLSVVTATHAQVNRWTRASNPGITASTRLAALGNSGLYLLGTSFQYTATQGASWTPCVGTTGTVVGVFRMDVGIAIAAANDGADRVLLYYSQSGLNWDPLDTLPQPGQAIGIGAVGNEFMVALRDGRVFKRTPDAWLPLAASSVADATQFITTPTMILVASATALAMSTDNGASWTQVDVKAASPIRHVREIDGNVYVASAATVAALDRTTKALVAVSVQPLQGATNVERYLGSVYALASEPFGSETRRRLFRFDASKTSWLAMADTLPGTPMAAQPTAEQTAVETGRMIVVHRTTDTATSGVYYVDLNVISHVDASTPGIAAPVGTDIIDTGIPATEASHVTVTDVMGRVLSVATEHYPTVRIHRHGLSGQPVTVTVQSPTGNVTRRLVMP